MEDLENNNWIILDPLGTICKIYANMTVMTLLNRNHLLITQAELCLKGTVLKGTFFIFMKILGENTLLSLLVLSILK